MGKIPLASSPLNSHSFHFLFSLVRRPHFLIKALVQRFLILFFKAAMSSNETNTPLEAMSAALRAATKMSKDSAETEELTPVMLASAIKLASLSAAHQEQLTPATVNTAIRFSFHEAGQEEQQETLTLESLAQALKLATKLSSEKEPENVSSDQLIATMKAAVAMGQFDQAKEIVTSEVLSDALKLAKE